MRCIQCNRKFYSDGILVSSDGDFVCSGKCKDKFQKDQEHFVDTIIKDTDKFKKWMRE